MGKFVFQHTNVTGNRLAEAMRKAEVAALNRVATGARTIAARNIRTLIDIPYGSVLKAIRLEKARANFLRSTLSVDRVGIKLVHFKPKPGVTGASVEIRRGQRKEIPHAFIVKKLSGNVFMRTSPKRKPIKVQYGPSIAAWFSTSKMNQILGEHVKSKLGAELSGKLEMYLNRGAGREDID